MSLSSWTAKGRWALPAAGWGLPRPPPSSPFPLCCPPQALRELLTEPTASPCGPPCLSPSPGVGQPGIAICGVICGVRGVRAHTEGLRPPVMKLSSPTAAPTPPPSPPPIRAPFCRPLPAILWLETPVRQSEAASCHVVSLPRLQPRELPCRVSMLTFGPSTGCQNLSAGGTRCPRRPAHPGAEGAASAGCLLLAHPGAAVQGVCSHPALVPWVSGLLGVRPAV